MFFPALMLAAAVGLPQDPPIAALGDEVTIGYTLSVGGKLMDSTEAQPPVVIQLGKRAWERGYVAFPFPGLDKALAGMKVGESKQIDIPASAGFGGLEVGGIPAGSDLTLDVKLLYLQKKGAEPAISIEELAPGEGPEAKAGDTLDVHYRGTFLNGLPFDNSYDRGQPFPVQLGAKRVIAGFDQGLMGMKKGQKRRVTIPYQLAYGEAGRPPSMPSKATLVFELEVLGIK